MKKIVFLLLLKLIAVPLVNGSDEVEKKIFYLTKQIINAYNNLELKEFRDTIAIITFDEPAGKGLGVGVSELIITELSKSGILHIVERKNLDKIIKEQELSLTGLVSVETAVKAGRLIGAHLLLVGSCSGDGKLLCH